MNELVSDEGNFREMVMASDEMPVTTTQTVAKYFGKQHHHVVQRIEKLECSEHFLTSNFQLVHYEHRGNLYKSYQMTKDGWMFLVMGFTGKKAAAIKESFIQAFNWMADQLLKRAMNYDHIRNMLILEYRQEKGIASLAGRTLQRWQVKKPVIEDEIQALEHEGQYRLFSA